MDVAGPPLHRGRGPGRPEVRGLGRLPWELLGGLLQGVPSVVLGSDEVLDPALFAAAVAREAITHLYVTPQLLAGLLEESAALAGGHQPVLVTSGADALPVSVVRRFREVWPAATLLNLYGMTETASNVGAYDTAALPDDAERVPVGRAVAGAVLSVRDRLGRRLPAGAPGEVWVSGPPLAWATWAATTGTGSPRTPPGPATTAPATAAASCRTAPWRSPDAPTTRSRSAATGWNWKRSSPPCARRRASPTPGRTPTGRRARHASWPA
ncbi:hypothetical protein BLA24_03770 [Streptomyces cinnamoneus]|uniref:AMP-dependent synthetase/ligase domain-containing protein n=1 Tax=Streptomyces cinnamoneus TaxID=53446 RepID=A0A2G1XPE1_STRCJ|nr:hypothetical protein BLA24_03770 [Streptomyces cinnamoneus]